MTRADEWHIKVHMETRRRFKAYAALEGLTLDQALSQLLDDVGETVRNRGGGAAPRTTEGRAGAAGLRVDSRGRQEQSGTNENRSPDSEAA